MSEDFPIPDIGKYFRLLHSHYYPEHIPAIILYLCTERAANINGHVFGASGGRIALYSNPTEIKVFAKKVYGRQMN